MAGRYHGRTAGQATWRSGGPPQEVHQDQDGHGPRILVTRIRTETQLPQGTLQHGQARQEVHRRRDIKDVPPRCRTAIEGPRRRRGGGEEMAPSINGNGDYHKIVGAMMASSKSFFSSSDFSEVAGVHMKDANRIIAELERRGYLER